MLIHIRKIEKAMLSFRFMIWVIGCIMMAATKVRDRGQSSGLEGMDNNFNFEFLALRCSFTFTNRYLKYISNIYLHIYIYGERERERGLARSSRFKR